MSDMFRVMYPTHIQAADTYSTHGTFYAALNTYFGVFGGAGGTCNWSGGVIYGARQHARTGVPFEHRGGPSPSESMERD